MQDEPEQEPRHRDKDTLIEMYVNQKLTTTEIADRLSCTPSTVSRWLDKHNIETRGSNSYKTGAWQDAELVKKLYHEKEMSGTEIADKLGCSVGPIYDHIEDTRSISEANRIWTWKLPLNIKTDKDGYERFKTKVHGESMSFAHHRLIAVAEHGFDALKGKVVHHKNGVAWDNRPENLELMSQSEHVREHLEEIPPREKVTMWALGKQDWCTAKEIGETFGHSRSTVTTIWKRIDDGDYPITEAEA